MGEILGLILVFLALSSGSFLGATLFNKKYGEMLPITCFFTIAFLYIFYILNILGIGFWLLICLMVGCYVVGIINFLKKKEQRKNFALNFLNPGILVFALFLIMVYFYTRNLTVLNFDELRLWGAYPKALYYSNELQFGESSFMLESMSVYIPGMALFQYFFTKCMLAFSEGYLYLAYAVLGVSILMPLTRNMKWKKCYHVITMLFIFLLVPLTLANSGFDGIYYYKALFIDPILGLIFGYACFLSINNAFENKEKYILFLLSLIVLVLLKDTGLILACIVYMSFFLNEVFVFKNNNYKLKLKNAKNYLKIIVPLLIIGITFFSWNITKKLNSDTQSFADSCSVKEVIAGIFTPDSEQTAIKEEMIRQMQESPIVYTQYEGLNKYLTFENFTILFIAIMVIMIIFEKVKKRASYIFGASSILIGLVIYSVAMLVFFTFGTKIVVCFERYFNTYFMGMYLYLFLIVMEGIINNDKKYKEFGIILAILSLNIFPLQFQERGQEGYYKDYDNICLDYSKKIVKLIENNNEKKQILVATSSRIGGEPTYRLVLYHHQLLLDLIEYDIRVKDDMISIKPDAEYQPIIDLLKERGYNYLFVIIENEEDAKVISECLGINIVESTLLELKEINNEYQLVIVEEK